MKNLLSKYISWRHNKINKKNRKHLVNSTPTLICSNCTGGVLYNWLGLRFQSPFINLYMENMDFIIAMENFELFISTEIIEDKQNYQSYPVGIGYGGVKIHFMHYNSFKEAIEKWNERKLRINKNNLCVWLTNFNSHDRNVDEVVKRFNQLPFKNKLIFSGEPLDAPNIIYLRGYGKVENKKNIFGTQNILGQRFIDQFDYVKYLNEME